jgi:hypothetical protein
MDDMLVLSFDDIPYISVLSYYLDTNEVCKDQN